jgi:hypothetical protein
VRHPLVNEEERDLRSALLQLANGVESIRARGGLHHSIIGAEVMPEIALDCVENFGVVVDREKDRFAHGVDDTTRV